MGQLAAVRGNNKCMMERKTALGSSRSYFKRRLGNFIFIEYIVKGTLVLVQEGSYEVTKVFLKTRIEPDLKLSCKPLKLPRGTDCLEYRQQVVSARFVLLSTFRCFAQVWERIKTFTSTF